MGAFVSYFFSGFILGKIPFPLSPSFRLMLQVPPRPPSCHAPGPPLLPPACSSQVMCALLHALHWQSSSPGSSHACIILANIFKELMHSVWIPGLQSG